VPELHNASEVDLQKGRERRRGRKGSQGRERKEEEGRGVVLISFGVAVGVYVGLLGWVKCVYSRAS